MARWITFTHPRVVDYLLGKPKYVATMRRRKIEEGSSIEILLYKDKKRIARLKGVVVYRVPCTNINIKLLAQYSGFDNPYDWFNEAIKLHHGKPPRYIYLIKIEQVMEQ